MLTLSSPVKTTLKSQGAALAQSRALKNRWMLPILPQDASGARLQVTQLRSSNFHQASPAEAHPAVGELKQNNPSPCANNPPETIVFLGDLKIFRTMLGKV